MVRPDLFLEPLGVVSRILMLAQHLVREANEALAPYGLTLWQLDVLGTLRRAGPPFELTPTQLTRSVLLSPSAMTNRLDRLERLGLVRRTHDPTDRRCVRINLSEEGRKLVDEAMVARLDVARESISPLTEAEAKELERFLRTLLMTVSRGNGRS